MFIISYTVSKIGTIFARNYMVVSKISRIKVGVEESHHGLQITDQLFKANLTFCVVCVFTLQADEWCVHNQLFNANFEVKLKNTPDIKSSVPGSFKNVARTELLL
jgi:hypothetical protein